MTMIGVTSSSTSRTIAQQRQCYVFRRCLQQCFNTYSNRRKRRWFLPNDCTSTIILEKLYNNGPTTMINRESYKRSFISLLSTNRGAGVNTAFSSTSIRRNQERQWYAPLFPRQTIHEKDSYVRWFSTTVNNADDSPVLSNDSNAKLMSEFVHRTELEGEDPDQPSSPTKRSHKIDGRMRRLDIAIVGLPNAGKSQLLNILTGVPVSAVSRKRHTTRQGIMAARTVVQVPGKTYRTKSWNTQRDTKRVTTKVTTQLLFVDTPGFIHTGRSSFPTKSLPSTSQTTTTTQNKNTNQYNNNSIKNVTKTEKVDRDLMIAEARREMIGVDFTVLVIDAARRFTPDVRETIVELMMTALKSRGRIEDDDDDDHDNESDYDDDNIDDDDDDDDTDSDSDDDSDNDEDESDDKHNKTRNNGESEEERDVDDGILPLQKFAIVLNKTDLIHPKQLLLDYAFQLGDIANECLQYHVHQEIQQHNKLKGIATSDTAVQPLDDEVLAEVMPTFFYTSALKNDGVDDLLYFLLQKATPAKVFEVEPGTASNLLPEEQATEIIREKIYRCLHKELPYQIQQENRTFKVSKIQVNGVDQFRIYIEQDLIVASRSHQDLVRGRGNSTIERIRESAEYTMKSIFQCDVTLLLNVKYSKNNRSKERDV